MQSCFKVFSWEVRNVQLWRKINPSLHFPTYIFWVLGYSVNEGVSRLILSLKSEMGSSLWKQCCRLALWRGTLCWESRKKDHPQNCCRAALGIFLFSWWVPDWGCALLSTIYDIVPILWYLPVSLTRNVKKGLGARHPSVWCVVLVTCDTCGVQAIFTSCEVQKVSHVLYIVCSPASQDTNHKLKWRQINRCALSKFSSSWQNFSVETYRKNKRESSKG